MTNTIIIQSKRGFTFDNIVILGLVCIGWSLVILSVFDMLLRGVADMACLLYTSPSPRDQRGARMPSSA